MPQPTCSRCGTTRPQDQFAKDRTKATGRKSWCKDCDNARCKRYYHDSGHVLAKARYAKAKPQTPTVRAPRPCRTCGHLFTPTSANNQQCSDECRRKRDAARDAQRDPTKKTYSPRACAYCGDQFVRRSYGTKTCNAVCAYLLKGAPAVVPIPIELPLRHYCPCPICKQYRATSRPTDKPCSETCWSRQQRYILRLDEVRQCPECGDTWKAGERHLSRRYCTNRCARRAIRRRGKAIRRARIKGAARREPVDIAVIAERDGWRCHICKGKVTRSNWSHDHLVPLSHGGSHTYDNALAHKQCNTERSDKGAAQLLLVG